MLLAVILMVFGILVTYLLLMPIILSINTQKNEYYIQLKGLAKANIEPDEKEIIRIRLKVFFMTFYFFPIEEYYKRERVKKLKPKKHKTKSREHFGLSKGLKVLKTFKIKQFAINIDTGNVITNAKLYPAFAFLNYHIGGFNVNFQGRNQLAVRLQNRPIDIIKLFINP
jgi:hypothetical protein